MKRLSILFLLFFSLYCPNSIWAQLEMYSINRVVDKENTTVLSFLESTNEHTTLLKAINSSGLKEILLKKGAFTILAPTDAAFKKLPKDILEVLLLEKNKDKLKAIIAYHIIPGNVNTAFMSKAISDNNGEAHFKTLSGSTITIFINEGLLALEDINGNESLIDIPDKQQSNGYVYIVDRVILPN